MESLEQVRGLLDSLRELRSIVKTMNALSAASIRQYEKAVSALAGYYRSIELGLHVVLKDQQAPLPPTPSPRAPRRLGAIVFGSDLGLCGRFNDNIASYALERMDAAPADPGERVVLAVGARVAAALEYEGQQLEEDFLLPGSASQITATVRQILLKVDEWREQASVHYVYLFYNRHSGSQGYAPTGIELLPINLKRFQQLEEEPWPSRRLPMFAMKAESLLSRLLHQYLFVSIFRACAESQASEHASRLAAMQAARRNLDERLEGVSMMFSRARQDAITAEIMEVVTGFEAITGSR